MKQKLFNINSIEIELLLLNIMISGMGVIRSYAWITADEDYLENASPPYLYENERIYGYTSDGLVINDRVHRFIFERIYERNCSKVHVCS